MINAKRYVQNNFLCQTRMNMQKNANTCILWLQAIEKCHEYKNLFVNALNTNNWEILWIAKWFVKMPWIGNWGKRRFVKCIYKEYFVKNDTTFGQWMSYSNLWISLLRNSILAEVLQNGEKTKWTGSPAIPPHAHLLRIYLGALSGFHQSCPDLLFVFSFFVFLSFFCFCFLFCFSIFVPFLFEVSLRVFP